MLWENGQTKPKTYELTVVLPIRALFGAGLSPVCPSIFSVEGYYRYEFRGVLVEEKVAVVPGSAFGECGEGYVRCCYATAMSDIEEALFRMRRFVRKHRK